MGIISDRCARELDEITRNAPKIDSESYEKAFNDVFDSLGEDVQNNHSDEVDAAIFIASAIHELANMLNEHLTEYTRIKVEEKYKED